MKKTIVEDWLFTVTVIQQGECRMGMELDDSFRCQYECPAGFCPKTMGTLHSLCEVARAGGDYRLLGGKEKHEMEFSCADGVIRFRLRARQLDV
ncbi:TIGR04076 family protein [Ruminococcaceae bacterium OttesenSCG-928-L11]|nr:TIGR04076 family protein [Ruminococcaceae bacterium OttesenSCG-928-L11]